MASNANSTSLTAYLLSIEKAAYASATRSPFLAKSGAGTLTDSAVCEWLVQDKYYQLGYVNFMGSLLSKIDLSPLISPSPSHSNKETTRKDEDGRNLQRTTMNILIDALTAIRQEIDLYDQVAEKYGLALEFAEMNGVTREYVELFEEVGKGDKGLLQGLVVLWATEHCYLTAWTYASSQAKDNDGQSQLGETGAVAALHREFIPNWTSKEFAAFVDKLGKVTDAWAIGIEDEEREVCARLWKQVLELEARFWPEV
ncbi:hypothetical protein ACLMJK_006784 [Lecanora helva]